MAKSKGSTNIRDLMFAGKHGLLPPKCPFPTVSRTYTDYVPNNVTGSVQNHREGNTHHLRTSSESFLIEEQPSWLDDLLNEPESPVRRGHRRSSSDSFAYIDASNARNLDYAVQEECRYKNMISAPSWASQEYDYQSHKDARLPAFFTDGNLVNQKKNACDLSLSAVTHPSRLSSRRENTILQGSGSSCALKEVESSPSTASEKQDSAESAPLDAKASSERKDNSNAKSSSSDNDTKRAKQQFAQRSRVRKLQYISELERNVQILQAEGSEVSAEVEFLNQQNLILNMENKALKQRLESLAQEQLIKHLEHEVLEREIGRLRVLYQQQQNQQHQQQQQQQQQQQKPQASSSSHRRSSSRDLDSQFANLSLKHKDASSGHDTAKAKLIIPSWFPSSD